MPFMKGPAPIRRTAQYLMKGTLEFKPKISIVTINYNTVGDNHAGIRDLVFWKLPQIQFRNPNVQIATFKNMTPTPFVRCFTEDGGQILIDVDDKSHEEIYDHLIKVIGKPKHILEAESLAKQKKDNPANFGIGCERPCICEVYGQVPCPGVISIPRVLTGKYRVNKK